jgi:adenylate cyclase
MCGGSPSRRSAWFRSTIEGPHLASGATQPEFAPTTIATGGKLLPLAQRAVDVGYRRHLDHYLLEDVIENIEVALDSAGLGPSGSRTPPGIAFVDLSGFTRPSRNAKAMRRLPRSRTVHGGRSPDDHPRGRSGRETPR